MLKGLTWIITSRSFAKVGFSAVAILLMVACSSTPAQPTVNNTTAGSVQPTQSDAGGASNQATATPDPDETAEPTPDPKPTATNPPGTVSLEIGTATGAKDFKYSTDTLQVPPDTKKIKLKFTNNTDPKDEIGHNWVLVKPGQEASVLANGIAAGDDKDWLNVDDPGIIAHTRLIEGNQRHTITFDAPAAGSYLFICTFPEHYAGGMKGTLTVQ